MRRLRLLLLLGLAAALALVLALSSSARSNVSQAVDILAAGEVAALREYILSFGMWAPAVSVLLMLLQSLAAPLPAFVLAVVNGLAFGLVWGTLLTVASATLAAAASFGVARVLGRAPVQALVGQRLLARADRFFARRGVQAVLLARLIPVVSFDVVSYAAGLTEMRIGPFLVATAIGMAPATFAYTYIGDRLPGNSPCIFVIVGTIVAGVILALLSRYLLPPEPA